jgi:hypothetical protein
MPRVRRTALTVLVATASIACATALAAVLPHSNHQRLTATSGIALADDTNGAALFTLSNLAPDATVNRCMTIAYAGAAPADVRLSADGQGSLAKYLDLTIEIGDGGGFGDCSGFTGAPVYSGTLDDLVTNHTAYASGVPLWPTLTTGSGVMLVSAHVQSTAPQLLAATMDLSIEARSSGTLTVSPAPTTPTTPTAPSEPTTHASPAPTPSTDDHKAPVPATPTPTPTTYPAPVAVPVAPAATPVTVSHHHTHAKVKTYPAAPVATPLPVAPRHPVVHRRPAHHHAAPHPPGAIKQAVKAILHAAVTGIERSPLSLTPLLLMLLFLLIQDRIDRRDPKLALAAAHADAQVLFSDPPEVPAPS